MTPASLVRAFGEGRIVGPTGPLPARSALLTPRSLLLMTANTVLKLPRPVRGGGVDRTTRTLRLYGTKRELLLGRRAAPHAYLADCGLTRAGDGYEVVDDPNLAEPTVAMWRQPEARRLDRLALEGTLTVDTLRPAMAAIAAFHEASPVTRRHEGVGAPGRVARRWREAVDAIDPAAEGAPIDAATLAALDEQTRAWLAEADRHLSHRVTEGRVRDLHLGLRLDHLYATDPVTLLDPDERPETFHWSDTAEDVALLAVELDALGLSAVAAGALAVYAELTLDRRLLELLPIFARLVALRRAGDLWRDAQAETGQAREHALGAARMYADQALTQPRGPRS